ncbi:hypothetical protein AC249_AIPGENE14096 [Exaiptasia diaphana]|nr:hypothetical protein AC249_AIPGENE14096 [Exaiptasia diaphana]
MFKTQVDCKVACENLHKCTKSTLFVKLAAKTNPDNMKIAIALLVVFSAVFMAAADEKAANDLPANDVEEEPKLDSPGIEKRKVIKPKVIVDKLSYRSCRYILERGLCKLHAILRKLCPALCRKFVIG